MSDLSRLIISNLAYNDSFSRRVAPFLSEDYFETRTDKIVYKIVSDFIKEYNTTPTKDAILICLDKIEELNDDSFKSCKDFVDSLQVDEKTDQEWLVKETETYCKERSIYNAIMESIHIIDGKSKSKTENAIQASFPTALQARSTPTFGQATSETSKEDTDSTNK